MENDNEVLEEIKRNVSALVYGQGVLFALAAVALWHFW